MKQSKNLFKLAAFVVALTCVESAYARMPANFEIDRVRCGNDAECVVVGPGVTVDRIISMFGTRYEETAGAPLTWERIRAMNPGTTIPVCRYTDGRKTFIDRGTSIWNGCPEELKGIALVAGDSGRLRIPMERVWTTPEKADCFDHPANPGCKEQMAKNEARNDGAAADSDDPEDADTASPKSPDSSDSAGSTKVVTYNVPIPVFLPASIVTTVPSDTSYGWYVWAVGACAFGFVFLGGGLSRQRSINRLKVEVSDLQDRDDSSARRKDELLQTNVELEKDIARLEARCQGLLRFKKEAAALKTASTEAIAAAIKSAEAAAEAKYAEKFERRLANLNKHVRAEVEAEFSKAANEDGQRTAEALERAEERVQAAEQRAQELERKIERHKMAVGRAVEYAKRHYAKAKRHEEDLAAMQNRLEELLAGSDLEDAPFITKVRGALHRALNHCDALAEQVRSFGGEPVPAPVAGSSHFMQPPASTNFESNGGGRRTPTQRPGLAGFGANGNGTQPANGAAHPYDGDSEPPPDSLPDFDDENTVVMAPPTGPPTGTS